LVIHFTGPYLATRNFNPDYAYVNNATIIYCLW